LKLPGRSIFIIVHEKPETARIAKRRESTDLTGFRKPVRSVLFPLCHEEPHADIDGVSSFILSFVINNHRSPAELAFRTIYPTGVRIFPIRAKPDGDLFIQLVDWLKSFISPNRAV